MKQLLLRVDDDLHARLAQQAHVRGVSVNAYANEILGLGIEAGSLSRTDRLKIKLMALGKVGDSTTRARMAEQIDAIEEGWHERVEEARRRLGPRDWIDELMDEVRGDRLP
ncbi:toxin-antitoxin system HicB family antitoxin [Schumannella luteola]|jgi:hypothetical protein